MSPTVAEVAAGLDAEAAGCEIHALAERLWPIPRSITGDGVRETLSVLGERLPLEVHEVPTGTPVLDWTVPREWNVRAAWIEAASGERVVDLAKNTLHVLGYSVPVDETLTREELDEHLYSLPDQPDRIPYRTSYYAERWGFCLPHRVRESLPPGRYRAVIDASLEAGHLTYGELFLPGEEEGEVLLSCHVCHPSLANDNLSGIGVVSEMARRLGEARRRLGYRFLFVPGTIGAITWLARNEWVTGRVRAGLVAANLGDPGGFHYKRSRRGDAAIDRAVPRALADLGEEPVVERFVPYGYDERQYCSPGFDLPVGSLTRTPWGRYPEYHTSGDDLAFIRPEALGRSLAAYLGVAAILEGERTYRNLSPKGEPQLGRRGLYGSLGGGEEGRERELAMLWVLNLSDGDHSLLDIAHRADLPFAAVRAAADALEEAELLAAVDGES